MPYRNPEPESNAGVKEALLRMRASRIDFQVDVPSNFNEQEKYWMKLTKKELTEQIMAYILLFQGQLKLTSEKENMLASRVNDLGKAQRRLGDIHDEVDGLMKFNFDTMKTYKKSRTIVTILKMMNRYLFSIRAITQDYKGVYDK